MKYPKFSSLVPAGEQFDSTAVNEAVLVSEGHLQNVENRLAENETAIAGHTEAVTGLNDQITSLTTERDSAKTELQTANQTIASKDEEIVKLNAKVAGLQETLNKQPGEEATNTGREKDDTAEHSSVDAFSSIAYNAFPGMKHQSKAAQTK